MGPEERCRILPLPVQRMACFAHLGFAGERVLAFAGKVSDMCGNLCRPRAFDDVCGIGKRQVLCRGYHAEEVCAGRCRGRPADGSRNMVIARGDVGYERP